MAEADRARKPGNPSKAAKPPDKKSPSEAPPVAQRMPGWLGTPASGAFPLSGVQRKVQIGASNDTYERQADHVASRVASGQSVPSGTISSIAPASLGAAQREEKKKEPPSPGSAVQKTAQDKKPEEKPTSPVQREVRPEDTRKDIKSAGDQLQRAAKPGDKKKDDKAASPTAVQKQAKPEEKKKDDKPASPAPVQKQAKPEEKKDDKPASPTPVQKQAKPEEKQKDDKPASPAPVQKQAKPEEKKDDKPASPTPVQKQAKPEEKKKDDKPVSPTPVQKQAKPEEKKEATPAPPVQRKIRPEDKKKEEVPGTLPLQRSEADKKPRDEGGSVQASRSGGTAAGPSMQSAASNAIASKGPGEPLHSATRGALESRMGNDLSDVRVHNDSRAQAAASSLDARAFTHGSDIWLGSGESQSDTRLMAHEATHVVQQTGSVHRMLVQRANDEPPATGGGGVSAAPAGGWDYEGKEGKVQKGKKLVLPKVAVPNFKKPITPAALTLPKKTDEERTDKQRTVWENDVKAGAGIDTKLPKKIKDDKAVGLQKDNTGVPTYFFRVKGAKDQYVTGSLAAIKQRILRPYWDRSGKVNPLQVDHKQELQLGGEDKIDNMWLLESDANMSSGRNIRREIDSRIEDLLNAAIKKDVWKQPPDLDGVRRGYTIEVEHIVGGLSSTGNPDIHWVRDEIKDTALQLDALQGLTKSEVDEKGLQGTPNEVVIYTNPTGGGIRRSKGWKPGTTENTDINPPGFGKLFHLDKVTYDRNSKKGSVDGTVFRNHKLIEEVKLPSIPLQELDSVEFGGFISQAGLTRKIQHELKLKKLSPIELGQVELTERGLVARGTVQPSIRPFDKASVDIVLDGDDVYLSKQFSAADFNFPGPIKVTSASLEIYAGTQGVGAKGDVFFEIQSVGTGRISGQASAEGPEITGEFNFDSKLFDPAKVQVEYRAGKFSGSGKIGIPAGKVKGIKSATIEASFLEEAIDAKGSITPDIPAVEQAELSLHYDPKGGLVIGGDLQLKKDIPGIADGSIHAQVTKKDDKYAVKASGEATPKIPGIASKLIVSYDDGLFDASLTAAYAKGMLKGSVNVGATNRPVGDDGKPAGEAPPAKAEKITIYGGGSLTLQLAPWLQATAGVKFKPDGEVEVTGKIGLPAAISLFDEKKVEKNIFHIGIPIPIVPGVSLNIGGGLDVNAGIGPGQLQEMELDVTYNPAHEEDTQVHGHAALNIPAHAGLRMNVHAALDVGIPLAEVEGGIELGGTMGIEGALHAAVDVDWSPKKGLALDASAEIYGEPKFRFDITGYVKVEVGVGWLSKTLWDKRWELAAIEYGSGLRLGLKMPIHYEEGKPFNPSLSDIQFEVPPVDPMSVLKGLIDKIT